MPTTEKCPGLRAQSRDVESCPLCNGAGRIKTQGRGVVQCQRCAGEGRVPMLTVSTIHRPACVSCTVDCDGRAFDAEESYVIRNLGRVQ